jgi:hypothetical protein
MNSPSIKLIRRLIAASILLLGVLSCRSTAQEWPYFVTYSHALEEPGNLEIAFKGTQGAPPHGNSFVGGTLELEYGALGWWTSEVYLSGQDTSSDSTVFTGFRWENRFRPLMREHFINPVLYVEYENVNEADRSFLEVVGHDGAADLLVPNSVSRAETERALELKLILSSNARGWNYSGNFIAEKALHEGEPWEFGYALGVSRPLALAARPRPCVLCRENFIAGVELYGGLGDLNGFGLQATSHYLGPTVSFNIPSGPALTFSPSFGLNANSLGVLYRFKVSYEVEQVLNALHRRAR